VHREEGANRAVEPAVPADPAGVSKGKMADIRAYMELHYHEPVTVASLARRAKLSVNYFIEQFRKTYGQSVLEVLTDLRINRAKRYLLETGERMKDIAVKVGYSDEFYFSRKFKKEVGMTPSEFARTGKRRIAAYSPSVIGHMLALDLLPEAAPLDPKWSFYYYNGYRNRIKSRLRLTFPYTQGTFEENKELLIQMRPDAIIGTEGLHAEEKAGLTAIAPACFIPAESVGWREQLRHTAKFLDREEAAELWISRYEHKVRSALALMSTALGTDSVIVLRVYGNQLYLYWNRGIGDVLYTDLQLRPLGEPESRKGTAITPGELAELDPDRIMLVVCAEAASRAYWLSLQHSALWRGLKAVAGGCVYTIQSDPWFEYSPVSIVRMLDDALLLFTGKCPNPYLHNIHGDSHVPDL